jgi:hypothetical protein
MSADHVAGGFVGRWFDLLSEHAPVDRLLSMASATDLEMVFPERTLRSHRDFRDWYATVGDTFTDQGHVVKELDARDGADRTDITLTVVWTATRRSDGARLAYRVNQSWQLLASPDTGAPVITRYRVLSLEGI